MEDYTLNPFTGRLDAIGTGGSNPNVRLDKFMGFTDFSWGTNIWARIARITINITNFDNRGQSFVGNFTAIRYNSNVYSFDARVSKFAKFVLEISYRHNKMDLETDCVIYASSKFEKQDIIIVEAERDNDNHIRSFDLYLKMELVYDRYFFSYQTNVPDVEGITFEVCQDEPPVGGFPIPYGSWYARMLHDTLYYTCTAEDEENGYFKPTELHLPSNTQIFKNGVLVSPSEYVLNQRPSYPYPTYDKGGIMMELSEADFLTIRT